MGSLLQLDRAEFLNDYFRYEPGEHLSLIYPTQRGKSHLAYQLLQVAMRQHPELNVVSLMPKPNSPATSRWAQALELRETPEWPPRKKLFAKDPAGFVFWPKHRTDLSAQENRAQLAEKFRKCLAANYWKGSCIVFADDVFLLASLMKLNPELEEYWTAGSEGGAALWCANQKPSGSITTGSVSTFSYNAPLHLFLGKDSDERNIKRFSEIGGIDPAETSEIVRNLRLFPVNGKTISEVLYIDQRGPYRCLIGP